MMARPVTDVTSWRFQAAIHGFDNTTLPEFNSLPIALQVYLDPTNLCQHFNPFFPAWHRLYIYYFERILRRACGDPTFNLPYWNYSDSTAERILPEAFRAPADEATNALYRALRSDVARNGLPLPEDVVSTARALAQATAGPSGGQRGFYTLVEDTPHGHVHTNVGGPGGLMSAFETAGLDPIFWLHHCNIDRLWAKWIRAGHADPTGAAFRDQRYRFFDEDGNAVSMTVAEVLDTAAMLDYRYDDSVGIEAGIVMAGATGLESGTVPTELAATAAPLTLGLDTLRVEAAPLVEAGGTQIFVTDPLIPGARPVNLVLQGIRFAQAPGISFRIFVNHPKDLPYDLEAPSYAGIYSPFAPPKTPEGLTASFDISGLLNRQIAAGLYDGGTLTIEIVALNPSPDSVPPGSPEAAALPPVTIDRITIER